MGLVMKMAPYWSCERVQGRMVRRVRDRAPRQCPKCGSRKWNDSIVTRRRTLSAGPCRETFKPISKATLQ